MNKFRNVPALITLLAGFAACVIMILRRYTLVEFLWSLVIVMLLFYIAGLLIRLVLNIVFKKVEEKKEGGQEENAAQDGQEAGEQSEADRSDNGKEQ